MTTGKFFVVAYDGPGQIQGPKHPDGKVSKYHEASGVGADEAFP